MTKQFLLAATALVAIGAAGAAAAGPITAASINSVTLDTRPATGTGIYTDVGDVTSYFLATEAVQPTGAANFTGPMIATVGVTGTSIANFAALSLGAGTYDIVFTLAGTSTPTWATAVAAGDLTGNVAGTCTLTNSVINGGGAGQGTVTIRTVLSAGCTNLDRPNEFTLTKGITLSTAGTATISGTVGNVGTLSGTATGIGGTTTTPAVGTSTAQAATLVSNTSIYDTAITADATATTLALAGTNPYSALAAGSDLVLGTVRVNRRAVTTGNAAAGGAIFAGLNSEGLPNYTYDARLNATTGNFGLLNATIGGAATTNVAASGTTPNFTQVERTGIAWGAAAAAALSVDLVLDNGTPAATIANATQDYTLAVTPSFGAVVANARFTTLPTVATTSLQSLSVQGTTFVAPWFGFSTTFNNVLRVSNSGTVTGPVTLAITSPTNSAGTIVTPTRTLCTSAELPKLANIPAGGEISINSTEMQTCFGTNPARADIRLTVQAASAALSAKLRIVNPGSIVTEQSLGAISQGVATTN